MADKRTIRRILACLYDGKETETRIKGYRYIVRYDKTYDWIEVEPTNEYGDVATSSIQTTDYGYMYGGSIYRKAVELAWEIDKEYRKLIGANDSWAGKWFSTIEWNGQITRYFDKDEHEYDMACANAEIKKGTRIYVLQWSEEGYFVSHIFNA